MASRVDLVVRLVAHRHWLVCGTVGDEMFAVGVYDDVIIGDVTVDDQSVGGRRVGCGEVARGHDAFGPIYMADCEKRKINVKKS